VAGARGKLAEAEKWYRQSYELRRALAEETGAVESRRDLSVSCDRLGDVARARGKLDEAEEWYRQSYELRKALAEETGTVEARRDLSISCNFLGGVALAQRKWNAALQWFTECRKIADEIHDKALLRVADEKIRTVQREMH
jgi:tetratricopeptide (TPR) repeat protein